MLQQLGLIANLCNVILVTESFSEQNNTYNFWNFDIQYFVWISIFTLNDFNS